MIDLERGAFLVFPTRSGRSRARAAPTATTMRHGVATVHAGERVTLGVIFHERELTTMR